MKNSANCQAIPKRIFICACRCLFSQGVEAFLLNDPELNVIGWEIDSDKAIHRIKETHPDAILIVAEPPFDAWLNNQVLFKEIVEATIITIKPQEDIVRVFRGEQHVAQDMTALVRIIKHSAAMVPDLLT